MSRRQTRIFRNLHYRWTFAGLVVEDLALITLPASLLIVPVTIVGVSLTWVVVLAFSTAVALVILKRNKPPGYVEALIAIYTTPVRFSHKERDRIVRPFPLEPKLLSPSRCPTARPVSAVSAETVS